jgi:ribosomal-protein-serine acetyltransferase
LQLHPNNKTKVNYTVLLSTFDLELRLLQISDAQELFALTDANRVYLRQWLPWLDYTNDVGDTHNFILSTLRQFAKRETLVTAICYLDRTIPADNRRIVGIIGFNQIHWQDRSGFIGYWLAESYRGRGIMTTACAALIDYAFITLDLNRLVIACASENQRSRAIPERLGFRHEGMIPKAEWLYDRFVDHEIYGLLDREWQSGKTSSSIVTFPSPNNF